MTNGPFDGFTYLDRIIVAFFMFMSIISVGGVIKHHTTPAEYASIMQPLLLGQSLFDIMSVAVLLFAFRPIISSFFRLSGRKLDKKLNEVVNE